MKLLPSKKKTVDSILSTFTTAITQLNLLTTDLKKSAETKRLEALTLTEQAQKDDAEALRAIAAVTNLEAIFATPVPVATASIALDESAPV